MTLDDAPASDSAGDRDRDRNAYGRPENARPRDRTGRPLAYDTDETELAEDHPVATVEQALAVGHRLFDEHRYFEAHELWEHVWHECPDTDRSFWQGVIQVAVAFVHHQRGQPAGVTATVAKALDNLADHPDEHHGIDVRELRRIARAAAAAIAADPEATLTLPALPVTDGPWFTRAGGPHPLPTEPSWMVAAQRRQARAAEQGVDSTTRSSDD